MSSKYLNDPFILVDENIFEVINGVYSGVKTTELDELAAETAAHLVTKHPGKNRNCLT